MTKSTYAFVYNVDMDVIYLDRVLLINFLTDYLICLVSAKICALPLRRGRYFAAAVIGSAYAAAIYLPGWSFLAHGDCKLAFGALMTAVCFAGEANFLRCAIVFFSVSAAFGGAAAALCGGTVDTGKFILLFLLCWGIFSLVFRGIASLPDKKLCHIELEFLGRRTELCALTDTGNALTDTHSGEKVMLISQRAAEALMPEYAALLRGDAVHIVEKSAAFPELRGKFRLLPCSTAAGTALLPLFRPDKVSIDGKSFPLLAAVSPALDGESFEGIIPPIS